MLQWSFRIIFVFTEFENLCYDELRHLLTAQNKVDTAPEYREKLKYTPCVSHQIEKIVDGSLVIDFVRIRSKYYLLEDSGLLSPPPFYCFISFSFFCLIEFIIHSISSDRKKRFFWLNLIQACLPDDRFTVTCLDSVPIQKWLWKNGLVLVFMSVVGF